MMNDERNQWMQGKAGADETATACPERETLKLWLQQPPPAGLEQRVLSCLREAAEGTRQRWWQMRSVWVSGVAAAALMAAAWVGVFHAGGLMSRNGAVAAPTAHAAEPSSAGEPTTGSFGTAGSMRVPPTVKPMYVSPAPRRNAASPKAAKPKAAKPKTTSPKTAQEKKSAAAKTADSVQ
jgi:hypothetical protein